MSREEAKAILKGFMENPLFSDIPKVCRAFDMAIKALEQQSCNTPRNNLAETSQDCISRKEVIDIINFEDKWLFDAKSHNADTKIAFSGLKSKVKALQPVTPKQKTGRWLMPQQDDGMSDPIYYQVRCSECGFDLDPQTWHMELHQYGADKYCPKCGARMAESEDKE